MKRIGILTGGGDVPGLNSVIKSVVYRSSEVGWEAVGIRRGWKGLTHVDTDREDGGGYLRPLDRGARGRSTAPAERCSTPRGRTPRR
jgi:ATP-dependent phosphofructokinase / diphosphate-dependent phosphofructokinase